MKLEELTDDAIDYILDGLSDSTHLNQWEKGFIESITDQWERKRWLSENQKLKLGEVWDRT